MVFCVSLFVDGSISSPTVERFSSSTSLFGRQPDLADDTDNDTIESDAYSRCSGCSPLAIPTEIGRSIPRDSTPEIGRSISRESSPLVSSFGRSRSQSVGTDRKRKGNFFSLLFHI